jgi:RNA polymerase sigma factor (sigma-70 family)
MTDQQIIQLIQQNKHSSAFKRLYRYFTPVQKLVQSRGGTKDDAKDVFQDALVILCKKVTDANFTLTASLDTYLYSVSRYLWNDELKRRGRTNEISLDEKHPAPHGSGWDVPEEQITEWVNDENKIKQAETVLEKLGKRCLQILNMFYTENKSMKSIAKKMEFTSENAAKNQKYKCLERAKTMLKESTKAANL